VSHLGGDDEEIATLGDRTVVDSGGISTGPEMGRLSVLSPPRLERRAGGERGRGWGDRHREEDRANRFQEPPTGRLWRGHLGTQRAHLQTSMKVEEGGAG